MNRTMLSSFAGLILFTAAVALIFPGQSAEITQTGWCCITAGKSCVRGFDSTACLRQGGLAFGKDGTICTIACATPVAAAAPYATR
jgi:hypothetical protein